MRKMNWGYGIVFSFIIFAAGTFIMVYIAMTSRVDLVTEDYYEKELKYQQHIDIMNNTAALERRVEVTHDESSLSVRFPASGDFRQYTGTVMFFRPSDKTQDRLIPVSLDSLFTQEVSTALLSQGFWRMKISWNVGLQQYYYEQPVIIQ